MSRLAVFGLKCPSLLDFERQKQETLHSTIAEISTMEIERRVLPTLGLSPTNLRSAFKKYFFQRGQALESYAFLEVYVLLSMVPDSSIRTKAVDPRAVTRDRVMELPTTSTYLEFVKVHPEQRNVIPVP